MNERISEILGDLVKIYSLSYSGNEVAAAEWFRDFFSSMEYFRNNPELYGLSDIPGDPFGRKVPYALVRGKKKETVILSGHMDVVTIDNYGTAKEFALDIRSANLRSALAELKLTPAQRQDLESGEWIFGRGAADMKGGLSVHAFLTEEFAKLAMKGELEGSVLFVPVCDEECYSAGMRQAITIMKDMKKRFDLDYKLMIDPEPTADMNGTLNMSLGTIGKIMPAVIVQGKTAHSGHCYEGISSLSIMSDIYLKTNGSLDFVDTYKDEASMPPCWLNMRDLKTTYDVSLPQRSGGYLSCLTFSSTPEEIIDKLKAIAKSAMTEQVEKLDREYQEFKKMNVHETKDKIHYEPLVLTFSELKKRLHEKDGEAFDAFFSELCRKAQQAVEKGEDNYPSATLEIMNQVLDHSGITEPCVILGFAPPYYPPMHADLVAGKEGTGTKVFEFLKDINREYGLDISCENYFSAISDLSYSAVTAPFNVKTYSDNTALWGSAYAIDFEAIEEINVPGIIYGPRGKDYHTFTERVNKNDLLVIIPETTRRLIEFAWKM